MSDPNFERTLRAAAGRGRPVGDHPDAALLAAYVDRSVSDAERAELEAHVANCTACMEHLGLLANVNVPDEPSEPMAWTAPAWLTRWGWLVPVASAAVLVVSIWIRQPAPAPTLAPSSPPAAAAPSPQTGINELKKSPDEQQLRRLEARSPASPAEPSFAEKTAPKTKGDGARKQAPRFEDAARQRAAQANGAAASVDALRERDLKALDANKPAPANVVAAAPLAVAPTAAPMAETVAPADRRADEAAAKNARVAGAAHAKEEKDEFVQGMLQKSAADAPVVLATGPAVILRRVGTRLERSTDSGTTWTVDLIPAPAALRLGTCPTADVCWLGGASGLVLRRDASGTWTRHVVADGRAAIIGLDASDALTATARLSDGRQFATTDGGVSWNKQ